MKPYYMKKWEEWEELPCDSKKLSLCGHTTCSECFVRWLDADADSRKCKKGECIVGTVGAMMQVTEKEIMASRPAHSPADIHFNNYCPNCRRPIEKERISARMSKEVPCE